MIPPLHFYGFGVSVAGTSVGTIPGGAAPGTGVAVMVTIAAGVAVAGGVGVNVGVGVGSYGGVSSHVTNWSIVNPLTTNTFLSPVYVT